MIAMKWTAELVRQIMAIDEMTKAISLDALYSVEDSGRDDNFNLGLNLQSNEPSPQSIAQDNERTEILTNAVNKLRPREIAVITARFGLDDGKPKTLQEVADMYHVTRERIRQIEKRGIIRLRKIIKNQYHIKNIDDI